jgi:hypothetical protein
MKPIALMALGALFSMGIAGCMAPVIALERDNREKQEAAQQQRQVDNQEAEIERQEQEVEQELQQLKKQQQK